MQAQTPLVMVALASTQEQVPVTEVTAVELHSQILLVSAVVFEGQLAAQVRVPD